MATGMLQTWLILNVIFLTFIDIRVKCKNDDEVKDGILVLTVATKETDGFKRFIQSTKKYGYSVKVLGMGAEWRGGDVLRFAGGGQKVNILRDAIDKYKNDKDLLLMFTDSYDVVFTAGPREVMKQFKEFDARIVFSAEAFCWPDPSLADKYPEVKMSEKRYLNSGGFIGYAADIYKLVNHGAVEDGDDDQLYYSKIFLNEKLREEMKIKLDTRSEIFQNLNGAQDEVRLKFRGTSSYLYNVRTGNTPIVVHGNGPIKTYFNSLANYLVDRWTPNAGCLSCKDDSISLEGVKTEDYPRVLLAVFIEHMTPFLEEFFQNIENLTYPKEKIKLFIHYVDEIHTKEVQTFMDRTGMAYNGVIFYGPKTHLNEYDARNKALEECQKISCQYYFNIDSDAHIENPSTLIYLIEANRSVIAPVMIRPGKMWSNFWGALAPDGFYKRSDDYVDIINNQKRGQWNVPHVHTVYLLQGHLVSDLQGTYASEVLDADMALCKNIRDKGVFMYADNTVDFGLLVNSDSMDGAHLHNDLYRIFDNKMLWERKYIHPEWKKAVAEGTANEQPCPDVYWFPLVTDIFTTHLVEEMENFGQWSGGKNKDPRLAGGYENVPTVDIHTNQIGWEQHWLQLLKDYIVPLAQKVFIGYYSDGRAIMNFVVRYRPGEQDRLRPHHDSSTYTINLALNTPHVDYEGGGVNFLRYNCTVKNTRRGWILMHPGRLTHMHEGLPTTRGTRYIMVSFIDP